MQTILGKYYLYQHIRLDTNEVFYVGIGTKRRRDKNNSYERANSMFSRSKFWRAIVGKTGFKVEILLESNDYQWISDKEVEFIKRIGRRNLGLGTLCNLTDGGSGIKNPSEEARMAMGSAMRGKHHSEETKKKIGIYSKGKPNVMKNIKGKSHPNFGKRRTEEVVRRQSERLKGKKRSEKEKQSLRKPKGKQKIVTCPYCGKSGGHAIHRWHFDNCKNKKLC